MALQDLMRTSRLHFMTLRGLPRDTRWLAKDESMRHHYLARITPWDKLTRRGRLNDGGSTRGWLEEDDSERIHSTRQDDSTRLLWVIAQEWIPKVVRVVCEGHLFCELCWRVYLFIFSIIWNVQSIINDIYGQSIVLIIIDTFHFISFHLV